MNKKKIVIIIVVIAVVVSIPSSVFAYNYYNFNKQVELGEEALENENFEDADKYFREALNYSKSHDDEINEDISLVESLKRSKELYEEGIKSLEAKKYLEAIDIFKSISEEKSKYYDQAQSKISESRNLFIEDNIVLAKSKAEEKKFDEGIVFLNEVLKLDENNKVALDLREQYNKEIEKIKAETEAKAKADAEEKEQISKKKSTNKTESTVGSQSNPTTSKLNIKIDGGWFSYYEKPGDFVPVMFGLKIFSFAAQPTGIYYTFVGNNVDYNMIVYLASGAVNVSGKSSDSFQFIPAESTDIPSNKEIKIDISVVYKGQTYTSSFYRVIN